jgi:hypothetical protein
MQSLIVAITRVSQKDPKVILGSVTSHPVLSYVVAREMPVLAIPRSCVALRCLNIVKKRGKYPAVVGHINFTVTRDGISI